MTATGPIDHDASPARRSRTFGTTLVVVTLAALAVRVAWVLIARRDFALHGDDYFYHWQANALADGMGFINPLSWKALGRIDPSAAHPPLYALYLAGVSVLGGTSALAHRLASCVLGAAAVAVVGLTGRRIAGERAGLIGAVLAAVYPMLWINDGMLVSESLYVLLIAAVLLAAYRFWDNRTLGAALLLGAMIGLAALTRPEAVLLVPLVGVPFLFSGHADMRRRVYGVLAIGAACLLVILPWWVRNLTTFEKPTFLATGHGSVLQSANCDQTYSGQFLGYWDIDCILEGRPPQNQQQEELLHSETVPAVAYLLAQDPRDESIPDARARTKAVRYIRDHLGRAPVVALARVGRVWGAFRVEQQVNFDDFFERRGRATSWTGTWMYYALLPFSVYALVVMRRCRRPISPMVAIVVMVTVTAAISIGITRYRVGADVMLTILGGVGIDALWRRLRRPPAAEPDPPAVEPELVTS